MTDAQISLSIAGALVFVVVAFTAMIFSLSE